LFLLNAKRPQSIIKITYTTCIPTITVFKKIDQKIFVNSRISVNINKKKITKNADIF